VQLLALFAEGDGDLLHIAASEGRAERLAHLLQALAPDVPIVALPAWDCLPYDTASPSREIMGRRAVALVRLAGAEEQRRIVVASPDALIQRVPPAQALAQAALAIRIGDRLPLDSLAATLERMGYFQDDRIDEVGEIALRGQVMDIFPGGATAPFRIEHDEGVVQAIRRYDPATQLSAHDEGPEALVVHPVSEAIFPLTEAEDGGERNRHRPGIEHRLPELYPALETVFDYLRRPLVTREARTFDREEAFFEQLAESFAAREAGPARPAGNGRLLPPDRLYLDRDAYDAAVQAHRLIAFSVEMADEAASAAIPDFATAAQPGRAFDGFVRQRLEAGDRVLLAAASDADLRILSGRAAAASRRSPGEAASWGAVQGAPPRSLLAMRLDIDAGFLVPEDAIAVIAAGDLLGSRAARSSASLPSAPELEADLSELRIGDAVVHLDHGVGRLDGLESVPLAEAEAAELARLAYAGDAKLMAPVYQLDRMWRYGPMARGITLDRLDGSSWDKRRASVEAELAEASQRLAALAAERQATAAPELVPPRRTYERFVARFPFAETPDQAQAIDAVLRDLASGRPMDRLVCGDVGFGKTEVALRAAAAAALAGKQVAVVAPTTVLVRQHLQTFRRRFADLDIEVGQLSRLVRPAEARAAKAALADGRLRIVIGTHALAAKGIAFADLGLVVIDEEQHFGAAHKAKLRALAKGIHVLTMTATPIPRTLQAAMVGLQEVSLLTSPPAERRPVRIFLTPFDGASVRDALLRERRRGGQSFVVCPRIEDIEPMAARLRQLVPELDLAIAHGRMPATEIDETMVRFADGHGDVLLATNIIESGLDVPRANTMVVWRPDRFGLAQLHQLRGRVGRGRARGICYLCTDPDAAPPPATLKRLRTLESLDRLGAGFAISAHDLEQRGAGTLLEDDQAGHVKLIGAGLYRHLLQRALRMAGGEAVDEDWSPEIRVGLSGRIPAEYVPEEQVRLNLYARICRTKDESDAESLVVEIEDRFGPVPEPVTVLLAVARLREACRRRGIARLDAGPQGVALTFRRRKEGDADLVRLIEGSGGSLAWKGERLVANRATEDASARLGAATDLIDSIPIPAV
jgi:transcription-repair coupling factor (superfamily II helicase)